MFADASQRLSARQREIVAAVAATVPHPAADGCCTAISGILAGEIDGQVVLLSGVGIWRDVEVVLFAHAVCCVGTPDGEVFIDLTATQFDSRLPRIIVADPDVYARGLAEATGAAAVRRLGN